MIEPDRVLPALLDRFTRPGETYNLLTIRRYTDGILRDLRWLLGARAHLDSEEAEEFPEVAKSVLNYGASDLTGRRVAGVDVVSLERQLLEIIRQFEPRMKDKTLTVQQVSTEKDKSSTDQFGGDLIAFEIQGEVWASPSPIKIRTELDLATGGYKIAEGGETSSVPRRPPASA